MPPEIGVQDHASGIDDASEVGLLGLREPDGHFGLERLVAQIDRAQLRVGSSDNT